METHLESLLMVVAFPLLLVAIFYWPGRALLRLATNGRYPAPGKPHNVELVAVIGLTILLMCLTAYYS